MGTEDTTQEWYSDDIFKGIYKYEEGENWAYCADSDKPRKLKFSINHKEETCSDCIDTGETNPEAKLIYHHLWYGNLSFGKLKIMDDSRIIPK